MVSTLVSPPASEQNSRSGKKKYKKNAMEFVDYETEYKKDPKFKTELCKTFTDTGFCAYGNKCRFAHGKDDLFNRHVSHPKYRKSDCMTFHTNGFCNYGARCHFRHNETLRLHSLPLSFYYLQLTIYPEKAKIRRLPIFDNITNPNHEVKNYYDVMNSIKQIMDVSRHNTNGSSTPFKPKTCIFNERKWSGSSIHSRSPIGSTATVSTNNNVSPNESIIMWKINRKLNFNDVNDDIPLYQL